MWIKSGRFLLLLLVLTLSGCFREADSSYQPVASDNTAAPPLIDAAETLEAVPELPTVDLAVTDDITVTDTVEVVDELPTLAVEEVIPTEETAPIDDLLAEPTSQVIIIEPTATDPFSELAAEEAAATQDPEAIITPQLPSLGIIEDDPIPTAASTDDVSAESGVDDEDSGVVPTPAGAQVNEECIYVVQPGDTLFQIALDNEVTLVDLRAANPDVESDVIQPGQELNLPNCGDNILPPPVLEEAPPTSAAPPGQRVHTVAPGETLSTIAQSYGVTIAAIVEANTLANPDRLDVGQELIIPQE